MNITASELIEIYGLIPHPEGGYYKETYKSDESIPAEALPKHGAARSYCTAIYFLLQEGAFSMIHRIKSDEIFHFYLGGPLTIVQISPDGGVEKIILGSDVKGGQKIQHVVPAGCWFGAYPNQGSGFCFVGCTNAPGFEYDDFELGNRGELIKKYPQAREVIEQLTR